MQITLNYLKLFLAYLQHGEKYIRSRQLYSGSIIFTVNAKQLYYMHDRTQVKSPFQLWLTSNCYSYI